MTDALGSTDSAVALISAAGRAGLTIATAESITCGLVSARLADVPGASAVLRGGVASYATEVKMTVLGVGADLVSEHGVVSRACAVAMARGARVLLGADVAVATTGVAGPDPLEGWPAGRVHVAAVGPGDETRAVEVDLPGGRAEVRAGAVVVALETAASVVAAVHARNAPGSR